MGNDHRYSQKIIPSIDGLKSRVIIVKITSREKVCNQNVQHPVD